eukprot:gene11398-2057_t
MPRAAAAVYASQFRTYDDCLVMAEAGIDRADMYETGRAGDPAWHRAGSVVRKLTGMLRPYHGLGKFHLYRYGVGDAVTLENEGTADAGCKRHFPSGGRFARPNVALVATAYRKRGERSGDRWTVAAASAMKEHGDEERGEEERPQSGGGDDAKARRRRV